MDKNTVTGFILIFLIMSAWLWYTLPSKEETEQKAAQNKQENPTELPSENTSNVNQNKTAGQAFENPINSVDSDNSNIIIEFVSDTKEIIVETPLYVAYFSSQGASINKFYLKNYKDDMGDPVQLIAAPQLPAYAMAFFTTNNEDINTSNLNFSYTDELNISINENDIKNITFILSMKDNTQLVYDYYFYGDKYVIDWSIRIEGALWKNYVIPNVDVGWNAGLNLTETDVKSDINSTSAYVYAGEELDKFQSSSDVSETRSYRGQIDWLASRTKFFTQVLKAKQKTQSALLLSQPMEWVTSNMVIPYTQYHTKFNIDIPENASIDFSLYLGPLDDVQLRTIDESAFGMVNISIWSWISWLTTPIVKWIILFGLKFINGIVGSMGWSLVIFAILIKTLLFPLSYKSMKSMTVMGELQGDIKKIRQKYGKDPRKQQQQMMNLYKKKGVNPLGGCIPMLLQFPLLIALFGYFQESILLRQVSFLWAADLSAPDYILDLPFSIPFLGSSIAGFTLLMTGFLVVQTSVLGGTEFAPQTASSVASDSQAIMKVMKYFMPIMLFFLFNNYAAGLSLYYLTFNILSMGQQWYMKQARKKIKEQQNIK